MIQLTSTEIQMLLVFPKFINLSMFLFISILLINKYRKTHIEERYILNRVFIFGFLSWFMYMVCDIILYPLASQSFSGIENISLISYYPSEYPSLVIANIMRDIGMTGAFLTLYSYFFAALILRKGEDWFFTYVWNKSYVKILVFIKCAILIAVDTIGVSVKNSDIKVEAVWNGLAGFSLLLIIILYSFSAFLLVYTILSMTDMELILKRGFRLIALGIGMMATGSIYWLLFGNLRTALNLDAFGVLIAYSIGHFIWTSSPLFIYGGLKNLWRANKSSDN